jgi:hypothetical protein
MVLSSFEFFGMFEFGYVGNLMLVMMDQVVWRLHTYM